ncbi:unnamed protein product [Ceratitis capitata]|uniref:(Mediterranean fruit fly) hypothetical protein n=1 Tax=Ceratitis capitata TaxID=7213 RepID=A0A811UY59_CERCA|nr:unnamed protein product [Ceratitis capitata]
MFLSTETRTVIQPLQEQRASRDMTLETMEFLLSEQESAFFNIGVSPLTEEQCKGGFGRRPIIRNWRFASSQANSSIFLALRFRNSISIEMSENKKYVFP